MKHILVCVKAVPVSSSVEVDGQHRLKRDGASLQWNIADESALEAAFRLADRDGSVTVLTMGPPKLEGPLLELLARGANRAVLITDRLMAGADTRATARALASAAEKLGPFDAVFCGCKAIDGETGQVPGELAAALGNDPNFATTMLNALAGKQPLDNTLTNLSGKDVAGLLAYLGLGEAAKRNVGNGQNQIPDMAAFASSLSSTGFQKLPSGLIIQWGIVSGASNYTVTYPVTFPNRSLALLAVPHTTSVAGISAMGIANCSDISKSQFNSYGLFKSYSGSFVIARISPFSGFITIIETLFACFCSRVFCASCCAYDCILISMLV